MIRLGLPTPRRVEAKDLQFIPADANLFGGHLPRTFYDYGRDVGQGFGSNVVMSPTMWIMRTFTEAHAIIQSRTKGVWKAVEDHPVEVLIDKPNDFYNGDALWKATCISYVLNGNAYWRKVRNRFGDVIQLWYTPHWLMQPKWPQDGSEFITHYEYSPMGGKSPIRLETRDVVHFRFGLDPENQRFGLSPLRPLMREIFIDDEAANYSAKMLENMGVVGMVVAPKDAGSRFQDPDVDKLKTAFTGDNRGATLILKVPTDVKEYGMDPGKLTLSDNRDTAEERVCAALGLPAAVVGFGSGMQSTKVGATMRELRRLAWVQCLTPMQGSMGKEVTAQLLPDFVAQTRRFRLWFDTSEVGEFEEEDAARATKVTQMVTGGILRVDRAQDMLDLEVDPTQEVYLRPSNAMPIDDQGNPIKPATPPGAVQADPNAPPVPAAVQQRLTQATGNGNGKPQ